MKTRAVGLIGLAAILLGAPAGLQAQPGNEPSRQERIREHNERIRKIIEESQRRRAEQEAAKQQQQQPPTPPGEPVAATPAPAGAPAATGQAAATPPAAAQPGQPLPTGPVQARMTPPIQAPGATPAPGQVPQSPRSESRTILMFHPIDSIVAVGERFKTDIVAETKEGQIDEISILLKYPRHILNPLALNHGQLDPFVKDKIDYEFNPEQGTIYLHANLRSPQRFGQKALLSIVWEALEPTDGAVISYEFGEEKTTGLYLNNSNLLGTLPGAEDGVIRTMVQVKEPKSKTTITQLADKGVIIGSMSGASQTDVSKSMKLDLIPQKTTVKSGEEFDVAVALKNPGAELVDRIQLYLQFDPSAIQVIDSDAGNVVTRGVNIRDAFARTEFPFDYYRYNSADNYEGTIVYEVAASNSRVRGDGKFAVIKLKALQEIPQTQLVLVQNAEGMVPTTNVSYLSQSRLIADPESKATALDGLAFRVQGKLPPTEIDADVPISPFESELAQRMRRNGN